MISASPSPVVVSVPAGSTTILTVTLTSDDVQADTITGVAYTGDAEIQVYQTLDQPVPQAGPTPAYGDTTVLQPGGTASFTVTFSPETAGSFSGIVTVYYNGRGAAYDTNIVVTGTAT